MESNRQFISNARWAVGAKLISGGLSVPFFLILGKGLGPGNLGLFSLTLSVLALARIAAGSGLGHSTGKHLSELDDGSAPRRGSYFGAGLLIQISSAIAVGAAIWLLAPYIAMLALRPENYKTPVEFRESLGQFRFALMIAAFALIFFSVTEFTKACIQGVQRFNYLAVLSAVEFGGKLFFAAGLAWLGLGLLPALAGYAFALVLTAITAVVLLLRLGMTKPGSKDQAWSLVRYSLPLILTTAGFWIYTELDNLMLFYYRGAAETGLYFAAINLARAIPQLVTPVGQAAAPIIVKLCRTDRAEAAKLVARLIKYLLAGFFPILMAIFVLAPEILNLYDPRFVGAAPALRVMAFYVLAMSLNSVFQPLLDYLGEAPSRAKFLTISVAANVALNLILIPRWGGVGAAAATAVTFVPYVLNNFAILARRVGLTFGEIVPVAAKILVGGLISGTAVAFIPEPHAGLFLSLVIGAGVYLLCLLSLRVFSPGEIGQVAVSLLGGAKPVSAE